MKKMAIIVLAFSVAVSVGSRRTSTITVTTTSTWTSTINGYTVTSNFVCALLVGVTGPCVIARNKVQFRNTLILENEIENFIEMFPQVLHPEIMPTETLGGETTAVMELPDETNVQTYLQQNLDSKSPAPNVLEPSMKALSESLFGWSKIGPSLQNKDGSQPRIFLVQIASIINLILHKILPPTTVTTRTTIITEASVTGTTSRFLSFFVQL